MKFNFYNYKKFCRDFKLYACRYNNLKIFNKYCNGDYDIIFTIRGDY